MNFYISGFLVQNIFAEGGGKRGGKQMVQPDEDLRLSIRNICSLLFTIRMKLHALISLLSIILCAFTFLVESLVLLK
jgi:hypothetical protein